MYHLYLQRVTIFKKKSYGELRIIFLLSEFLTRKVNRICQYITEFAKNRETGLGCKSRAKVLLIHEIITRFRKSHATVPLKECQQD